MARTPLCLHLLLPRQTCGDVARDVARLQAEVALLLLVEVKPRQSFADSTTASKACCLQSCSGDAHLASWYATRSCCQRAMWRMHANVGQEAARDGQAAKLLMTSTDVRRRLPPSSLPPSSRLCLRSRATCCSAGAPSPRRHRRSSQSCAAPRWPAPARAQYNEAASRRMLPPRRPQHKAHRTSRRASRTSGRTCRRCCTPTARAGACCS